MKVLHSIMEFRQWRKDTGGAMVPFVPTMGALHDGHASLVRAAREMGGGAGKVTASIFVNPTQFGPVEDFTKYPRTLEADCHLLQAAGCDGVFVPSAQEMYGLKPDAGVAALNAANQTQAMTIDPGPMGTILDGAIRPGHFRGVCTVVLKLLNIVTPTHLLLGQKDFQQQAILRQMTVDLNLPVEVVTLPTMREADGLAMSSRNRYLSPEERVRAVALYEALTWAVEAYRHGEKRASALNAGMEQKLTARGLITQYAVVVDDKTLAPKLDVLGHVHGPAVLLIAAKLGNTRLIDNMLL